MFITELTGSIKGVLTFAHVSQGFCYGLVSVSMSFWEMISAPGPSKARTGHYSAS